jgi:hypothetical protein
VYINCQVVAEYDWERARHYGDINISGRIDALRLGENVLAVETKRPMSGRNAWISAFVSTKQRRTGFCH